MTARRCANPGCDAELVRGQRAVYGSRESERQFQLRIYCSLRCAYQAASRKQYAKAKRRA